MIGSRTRPATSSDDEIHVWWSVDIHAVASDRLPLTAAERHRAGRFRHHIDRARFAARRRILRALLATYTDRSPGDLRIESTAHGRPHLAGQSDRELEFSVAHSGDAVVYALALAPVGVDIELVPTDVDVQGLASLICSSRERTALATLHGAALTSAFFTCWTHKEAVCKGDGRGLTLAPSTIDVADAITTGRATVDVPGATPVDRWRSTSLALAPGTAGAVAVPAGQHHRLVVRRLSRDAGW